MSERADALETTSARSMHAAEREGGGGARGVQASRTKRAQNEFTLREIVSTPGGCPEKL